MARLLKILAVIVCFWAPTAYAQSEFEDGDNLATALSAIQQGDWVTAEHLATQMNAPEGQIMITWARLRAGEGDWWEYQDFLQKNPQWPGLKRLRKRAEAVIPKGESPKEIRAFFAPQAPQTGTGALRLVEALQSQGRTSDARTWIINAWTDLSLTRDEQAQFMEQYKGIVSRYHIQRLENLLWRGATREANRMMNLVPPANQALAQARIGLQRAAPNVDALIAAIPSAYTENPGLAYDRFQWRMKKDRWDDAHDLLVERTGEVAKMGRPEKWANRRRGFARRAMRANLPQVAYLLASQHSLTEGAQYADLEWLSGYISLTYLNAPQQAQQHFKNFDAAVSSPISRGRAGYWLGQVHEKLGDLDQAAKDYAMAAEFQTSFYGQLSAERIKLAGDVSLAGTETIGDWKTASFASNTVFNAATLLHHAQEPVMMRWFMTHMAETLPRDELLQLADYADQLGENFVTLGIAKEAAKRGIVMPKSYYPVTDLAGFSVDVPPEIAMAIARRESELNVAAVSPAGARGLMQIMPATARQVAEEVGLEYSKERLTSDWRYNATLGTAYLGGLIEIYEGSYVLAFAAYNAGPHRVDEWIELYGDPRDPMTSVVDWVEHIPFRETRNYVMRVAESLHVYRARLDGTTKAVQLMQDLTRG
jgi:soluble lytic murein transglycosylase